MSSRPRDEHGRPLPAGSRDRLGADDTAALGLAPGAAAERGLRLLDAGRSFEAHEFLEYVWKHPDVPDRDRPAWKAATQVAVGWCHLQRGNRRGAMSLLRRGARGLAGSASPPGLDAAGLGERARAAADAIEAGGTPRPTG